MPLGFHGPKYLALLTNLRLSQQFYILSIALRKALDLTMGENSLKKKMGEQFQ